jgi:hypothetical protein
MKQMSLTASRASGNLKGAVVLAACVVGAFPGVGQATNLLDDNFNLRIDNANLARFTNHSPTNNVCTTASGITSCTTVGNPWGVISPWGETFNGTTDTNKAASVGLRQSATGSSDWYLDVHSQSPGGTALDAAPANPDAAAWYTVDASGYDHIQLQFAYKRIPTTTASDKLNVSYTTGSGWLPLDTPYSLGAGTDSFIAKTLSLPTTTTGSVTFMFWTNLNITTSPTGRGAFIDNVLITANPVPEPETYAMLLAGLGLIGLIARRRKQ